MRPISDILAQSTQIYRLRAAEFIGYAGWLLLPTAALLLASFTPKSGFRDVLYFVIFIFQILLWLRVFIILATLSQDAFTGKQTDAVEVQNRSRERAYPFLIICLMVAGVVLGGTLLFIIPGVVFAVWFGFAQLLVILEGKRGLVALAESRAMVQGRFWNAARYQFVGPITVVFVYSVILAFVISILAFFTGTPMENILSESPPLWVTVISAVGDAFTIPLVLLVAVGSFLEFRKGE